MKTWADKILFSAVILLTVIVPLAAKEQNEPGKTLTITDAVKIATEENITIKRNQITVEANKRSKDHSWNSISPSISLGTGLTKPNDTDSYSYDWTGYAKAGISFSFSPSLFTAIKTAQLNYEKGLITYREACRNVELSVRTSFYGLLYEQENIILQQRNLDTAKQQYEQNLSKYENGRVTQLDVLTAQVTYEKLKPTVESAQVTFTNDMDSFKQLLNISPETPITLSGSLNEVLSLSPINFDDSKITALVEQSAAIATLEKELETAKTAVTASRFNAFGPTVTAGWTYEPTVTNKTTGDSKDSGSLSLSVSIPLDGALPWSKSADTTASAKDTVKDIDLQLKDERTSVSVHINNYLRQIKQAQSTVKSLKANIDLAQQTYDMTLEAYNHGTKDLLSLQNASDSLLEAKTNLKSEAYTLIKAILNLENTAGVPFGTLGK